MENKEQDKSHIQDRHDGRPGRGSPGNKPAAAVSMAEWMPRAENAMSLHKRWRKGRPDSSLFFQDMSERDIEMLY